MGRNIREKKPGQVTIGDVARLAEVSISTVSRVINDSSYVEGTKKERIELAIRELGFAPKAAARALAGVPTRTIGLLVPSISDDFLVPMLRGIEGAARQAGYELLIRTTRGGKGGGAIRSLGERDADGLLLFADSADPEQVAAFASRAFPVVLLYAEADEGLCIPSVTIDSEGGAAAAVAHLIEAHGRRRIVCLTGPGANYDAAARLRGYRSALEAGGIPFDPALLMPGDFSAPRAALSIRALLGRAEAFDAVFACDDGAAMGAIAALRDAGKAVGPEVSVLGFDDVAFAALASPALATVWAPTEEVGAEGLRILVGLVEGDPPPASRRAMSRVFPTVFVPRPSCGCERKAT
jgi:LacI family transcriptional regulator